MFPPTLDAAVARITSVNPKAYARTRNALEGAVSRLSPYITHGFVGLPDVLAMIASRHVLDVQHKFVYELGWREYFHHVWSHKGDGILHSLHPGPLPDTAYENALPVDIREARTGIPVIDESVRSLYTTGYLHNHARMWLASYVVHLRKIHWRTGADWMVAHLLDGDIASNHLSWQWVAGTASHKPYLFNADNVARYAPERWHSPGSVIDTTYEALDHIARRRDPVTTAAGTDGIAEPALYSRPSQYTTLDPAIIENRDVWLVHPWSLGDPPDDLPPNYTCVAWWPEEHHAVWPWSAARWEFVGGRVAALTSTQWYCNGEVLGKALAGAKSVQTTAHANIADCLPNAIKQRKAPRLFADADRPCTSFSSWWNRVTRGVDDVTALPGMATHHSHTT